MNRREIKFRVWDKENKCWHSPNILEVWDESGEMTPFEYVKTGKLNPLYMPLDNWIIQQYTGLKDRNKKEIYDGDIIKSLGEIFFYSGSFCYWKNDSIMDSLFNIETGDLEVVGNIFERIK